MRYIFIIIFIRFLLPFSNLDAQCTTIVNNLDDTICAGDSLYGYYKTGVYNDTFKTAKVCDSVRVLDLVVNPKPGEVPSSNWFNTGTNGHGGTLPPGSNDLKWEWSSNLTDPYAPAVIMKNPPAIYISSPWPDCAWIAHKESGEHTGEKTFYYKIEFELPCLDSCGNSYDLDSTYCLTLDFFADNSVYEIYVNGVPQSPNLGGIIPINYPYTYAGFVRSLSTSVSLCNNWKSGLNTLIVETKSGAPYQALLAQASTVIQSAKKSISDFKLASGAKAEGVDTGCAPYTVHFINQSKGAKDYRWDFGDSSLTTDSVNPYHTFSKPGVYIVNLYVSNDSSCAIPDTNEITIKVGSIPTAGFKFAFHCHDTVCFTDISSGNSPIKSWKWNFGDGDSSISQDICHKFPGSNNYNTRLIIEDILGCTDTIIQNVKVPLGLTPSFSAQNFCLEDSMQFTDQSSPKPKSWHWDFGDSSSSNKENPKHKFGTAGNYKVTLVTTSPKDCKDTLIKEVEVLPSPKAAFTAQDVCFGDSVYFTDQSSLGPTSWQWNFDDGITSTKKNPSHYYQSPGTYQVTLRVQSDDNCEDSLTKEIAVNPNPKADFTGNNLFGCTPLCSILKDTSSISSGYISKWQWNLGDGRFKSGSTISACYENRGLNIDKYTIGLTVTSDKGCSDSSSKKDFITIYPSPRASFTMDSKQGDQYHTEIHFKDNSQGSNTWLWNFGDGNASFKENPLHKYKKIGNYKVRLKITNQWGCDDLISKIVRIKAKYTLFIPDAFTPDKDGLNENFYPVSYGVKQQDMYIFDRWGEIIYEGHRLDSKWDGTMNGKMMPPGVYVYKIVVEDLDNISHTQVGHVTVLK